MYASVETEAILHADELRKEAQRLLSKEKKSPRPATTVAAMFLSLGHLIQGKDHAVMQHLGEAANIGTRLCLFGVPENEAAEFRARLTTSEAIELAYPAWGVFNLIV
jgi:hypothetical protein